jgi:hypothetical protein
VTSFIDGFHIGNLVSLHQYAVNLKKTVWFLFPSRQKQPKFSHYNPICGSDGKTYKNECQLRKRACRQENKILDVAYKGHCQSKKLNVFLVFFRFSSRVTKGEDFWRLFWEEILNLHWIVGRVREWCCWGWSIGLVESQAGTPGKKWQSKAMNDSQKQSKAMNDSQRQWMTVKSSQRQWMTVKSSQRQWMTVKSSQRQSMTVNDIKNVCFPALSESTDAVTVFQFYWATSFSSSTSIFQQTSLRISFCPWQTSQTFPRTPRTLK